VTDAPVKRVRVTCSRAREHIQDIHVREGDSLTVGHRNQQHPAFVWCTAQDGHHGWVAEEYLEMVGGRGAVARRDYDSAHLTVVEGELLEVVERVNDYVLCRNAHGARGWVAASCLEDVPEDP
jgi:hypothetical protein